MNSNNIKSEVFQNEFPYSLDKVDLCKVSKASTEIMLERFCNGKEIEFPFLNN